MNTAAVFLLATTCCVLTTAQFLDEIRFDKVVTEFEKVAFEFRDQVEALYADRCTASLLQGCAKANYDECRTEFPNPTCPNEPDYRIGSCGEATSCSGVFDFSTSSIRFAPSVKRGISGEVIDDEAIEAICFTRQLDGWFQDVNSREIEFWENFGYNVRNLYFGSQSGSFRIYPARQSNVCGLYDASERPWYVAGSSGRKNVVLVLDSSGSMKDWLDLMKRAATRVIDTLTLGDKVAIISFANDAQVIANEQMYLYDATDENKVILRDAIEKITAIGASNFANAFTKTFDVLDNTIANELNVQCNTAILFLTDGGTKDSANTEEDVISLVNERLNTTASNIGKPIFLFTYSVGGDVVQSFPSKLACSTKYGIWSRIDDENGIEGSLSSYYKLFALGLGADANNNFAAWVEPFEFKTGDILGTTVSVPVYDRSKTPHLFLGVVGIGIALSVLNEALGTTDAAKSVQQLALRSFGRCPVVDLTECELESYRIATAGPEASCSSACTDADFVQTLAQSCSGISDYPSELIDNDNFAGKSFEERVCCAVGEEVNSDQSNSCPEKSSSDTATNYNTGNISTGAIVGIAGVAVTVVVVVLTIVAAAIRMGKTRPSDTFTFVTPTTIELNPVEPAFQTSSSPGFDEDDEEGTETAPESEGFFQGAISYLFG